MYFFYKTFQNFKFRKKLHVIVMLFIKHKFDVGMS